MKNLLPWKQVLSFKTNPQFSSDTISTLEVSGGGGGEINFWNGIKVWKTELQIKGDTEDNSKIIFLVFQQKHML